jgi:DNA-binding CsgD family transcriptional regulator
MTNTERNRQARNFRMTMMLLEGRRNKSIAKELGIGLRTVEKHRAKLHKQFDTKSCIQLGAKLQDFMNNSMVARASISGEEYA